MCVPNFTAVHPVVAETFQTKPQKVSLTLKEKPEDHQIYWDSTNGD